MVYSLRQCLRKHLNNNIDNTKRNDGNRHEKQQQEMKQNEKLNGNDKDKDNDDCNGNNDVGRAKIPVKLNIYGIPSINKMLNITGLGIYHTGVEVYGIEWAYGGYPLPISSIFRMSKPKDVRSLSQISNHLQYEQTLMIGYTELTLNEIEEIVDEMGKSDYIGTRYHLLNHNCNTFSNEFCRRLCQQSIPSYLNRLAMIIRKFPYITQMIPDEYFTPVILENNFKNYLKQQQPQQHHLQHKQIRVNPKRRPKQQPLQQIIDYLPKIFAPTTSSLFSDDIEDNNDMNTNTNDDDQFTIFALRSSSSVASPPTNDLSNKQTERK